SIGHFVLSLCTRVKKQSASFLKKSERLSKVKIQAIKTTCHMARKNTFSRLFNSPYPFGPQCISCHLRSLTKLLFPSFTIGIDLIKEPHEERDSDRLFQWAI